MGDYFFFMSVNWIFSVYSVAKSDTQFFNVFVYFLEYMDYMTYA